MDDILGKIIILSEETLKKIFLVEKTFNLSGEVTEVLIRKMADLLLKIDKDFLSSD